MPVVDKYRDMGTMVMGKSEQGLVQVGDVVQVRWGGGGCVLFFGGGGQSQTLLCSSHYNTGFRGN